MNTRGQTLAELPLPILLQSLLTTATLMGRESPSTATLVRAIEQKFGRRRRKPATRKGVARD
jgi:hypothetical protein